MSTKPVAIACDHAGFALKTDLLKQLADMGHEVLDLGTNSEDSVDYPDFGFAMAQAIRDGKAGLGVLVCGSGIGISIAANRYPEVRQHNDANVICFGGRMIGAETAKDCLKIFLETDFEGGRHGRRVDKLSTPA